MTNDATEVAPGLWRSNRSSSIFATGSHREMSSFQDAVQEWNRRLKDEGWRSSFAPQLACRKCQAKGLMLTTIYGHTTASCAVCEARWEL